jgi:uncharacterized protein (TIGR02246 family)
MATRAKKRASASSDESDLRELIARWSGAVQQKDWEGIRADHDEDILMFDVPPPFLSRGIDAYMATWKTFFTWAPTPVMFQLDDLEVTASQDVAFATATGRCINIERSGDKTNLKFRLTMGFRKHDGRWRIVHEHHSLPATDQIPE